MLKSALLSLGMCLFTVMCTGQGSFFTIGGAQLLSKANAGTMEQGITSLYTNPAGLVTINGLSADLGYERRYGLDELSTISIGAAGKWGGSYFGLTAGQFGSDLYAERKLGLTYARRLMKKLSIGTTFSSITYDLERYGSTSAFVAEVGLQSVVSKKVSIGAYIFSPSTSSLNDDQDIPTRFTAGVKYKASSKANVFVDISKTIDTNPDFKIAVDYHVVEQLYIRAGTNITQSSMHFGPAFKINNTYMIVGGYSYDNRLGHSSAISLTYAPGE